MSTSHESIGVLMGGCSLEHEVSLASGAGVTRALAASGHHVVSLVILKDGSWQIDGGRSVGVFDALTQIRNLNLTCIFIALHGPNGEDGRLQGLFDVLGYVYTGSGCAASALAIDKPRAKDIVGASGISTAPKICFSQRDWQRDRTGLVKHVLNTLGLPAVIKAPSQGSSCGMAIAHTHDDFIRDLNEIIPLEGEVMVEAFLSGLEVTCSVLDTIQDGRARALPVTEICPKESIYFDYYSKYTAGVTDEITPARISDSLAHRVQELGIAAHRALGCRSWSRSDFIICEGEPVWLELNTLPGLTETSLFPQAAAVAGITYNDLIMLLTKDAIERHKALHHNG